MKALNDGQRILAEQNHNLIYTFLNQNHLNQDEYYGDMAEAYCIAIASYDERKGKLSSYIFVSLGNRLKNIYRGKRFDKVIPEELLDSLEQLSSAAENALPIYELVPDRRVNVENEVFTRLAWEQIRRELSKEEMDVLLNVINREHTQRELASMYNMSQTSYVRREAAVKEKALHILLGTHKSR